MAQQSGYGREGKALQPLRQVVSMFKQQTLAQLRANMQTQRIYPYEVYPGYMEENEYRRQHGAWYSTGQGAKSFEGEVIEADETTGMVTLSFRFNDYMQYVDIGVMQGVKSDDVNRSKKIQFKNRYISKWAPRKGSSHRSGIRPELNHLLTRLENYCESFYGTKLDFRIQETLFDQPFEIKL